MTAVRSKTIRFEHAHTVPVGIQDAFSVFADPSNLARLTPRLLRFRLVAAPERMGRGARFRYSIAPFGLPLEWVAEITEWDPPHSFSDVQLKGPYEWWSHTHRLMEVAGGTKVRDRIEYRLRGGRLGSTADRAGHRLFLERLFAYRSKRLDALLVGHVG